MHACMHACVRVYTYTYTYAGMCIYIYTYTHIHTDVCVYIYICIHICIRMCGRRHGHRHGHRRTPRISFPWVFGCARGRSSRLSVCCRKQFCSETRMVDTKRTPFRNKDARHKQSTRRPSATPKLVRGHASITDQALLPEEAERNSKTFAHNCG